MKFGKSLSNQIDDTLPEWRDKFLSYKELKKRLKLIHPNRGGGSDRPEKRQRLDADCSSAVLDMEAATAESMTEEEFDFIMLLEAELEKFNAFFVEKEEEYIIRLKELQDMVATAKESSEEIFKIRKEIVDFHGEMILLENYSALNYTGLAKILKKYDKRTGAVMRLPFIQKVLQQPFFTTDLLNKLVKECETMLDFLFPVRVPSSGEYCGEELGASTSSAVGHEEEDGNVNKEVAVIEKIESLYMKSTISALRVLKEIRSGSSTVSVFSLPPLQISGLDDSWNRVPVLEQVAK
ncbi:SPX domain-containing protein 2 [Linum perenne]